MTTSNRDQSPEDATKAFSKHLQACFDALNQQQGNATSHWNTFDAVLTSFDAVDEKVAMDAIAQLMDQLPVLPVTRALARRATERFATNARAWYFHGRALLLTSTESSEALPILEKAWALDPKADALLPLCLAAANLSQKRWKEAEKACRTMLADQPNSADAYSNLAISLRMQYRTDEAIEAGKESMRLAPEHEHAPLNLALALVDAYRFDEALELLRSEIAKHPQDDRLRLPLGELELRLGIWETGWANMHARFSLPGLREQLNAREKDCGVPHWRGESLEGRTLGVWLEQGYGDAILLIRFLPLIAQRVKELGGKLAFGCFGPLVDLFKPLIPADVELNVDFLKVTDFHIPLMSCCAAFVFGNDTLPGKPYLTVAPESVADWRKRIGAGNDGRLHVALAWTGNPEQTRNDIRSLPHPMLEKLLDVKNVVFHSMNPNASGVVKELAAKGFNIVDQGAELKDFSTTAALILAMDRVVTTCTSTAHLAGAVGAPTLLMLDRVASFIWGNNEQRSPWYDSVQIVRQAKYGDWSDVVERTRAELVRMQSALPAPKGKPAAAKSNAGKKTTKGKQAKQHQQA